MAAFPKPEIPIRSHANMLESQAENCKRRMLWNEVSQGGAKARPYKGKRRKAKSRFLVGRWSRPRSE
jgi:hypothetical protein